MYSVLFQTKSIFLSKTELLILQTPLSPTKPNINDDFLNQQSYREDLINQSNYRSRSNTLPQRLDLQPKHNFNIQAQVGMVQVFIELTAMLLINSVQIN